MAAIPGAQAGLWGEGGEAVPAGCGGEAGAWPCEDLCVTRGSKAKCWTGPREPGNEVLGNQEEEEEEGPILQPGVGKLWGSLRRKLSWDTSWLSQ